MGIGDPPAMPVLFQYMGLDCGYLTPLRQLTGVD